MSEITLLGTGNAAVTKCYNTCFVITTPTARLLVDAGGGNGILVQLEKAGIPLREIHHLYMTHAHTDHILGCVWVVRMIGQQMAKGSYEGELHVYGHDKVLKVLTEICGMTLPAKITRRFGEDILFHEISSGEQFRVGDMQLTGFDIGSTKEKQFGFQAVLPDGRKLVCLGDEPYNEVNAAYVEDAEWLLCEAFCRYADRDRFKPYEKHHCTTREVGEMANRLKPRHLLVYHTEDSDLAHRKQSYTADIKAFFAGDVQVPDDLETITL